MVPTELVSAKPELAAGIVVFACWIGNSDRGEDSIAFSVGHQAAPSSSVTGGSLRSAAGSAVGRLAEMRDLPCVGGCLSGLLQDGAQLYPWIQRISSLPSWCVADLCQEAEDAELITPLEAGAALDFLPHRKAKLGELIGSAPDKLPHVARGPLV